jgi:Xaa-Pro aminopeptidase
VLVEPREIAGGDPDRAMLGFETLTLCPIERDLVDASLLTEHERAWIDAYHARVADALATELDEDERIWLRAKCAPL